MHLVVGGDVLHSVRHLTVGTPPFLGELDREKSGLFGQETDQFWTLYQPLTQITLPLGKTPSGLRTLPMIRNGNGRVVGVTSF